MGVIAGRAPGAYGDLERVTGRTRRVVRAETGGERDSIGDRRAGEIFVAREPRKMVVPRLEPAVLAESRRQIVIAARPIKIVLHLVLTSPQHFDRAVDLLRNRG